MALAKLRRHDMLPALQHDEQARQDFVYALRGHLSRQVMPGNYQVYERRVVPRFQRRERRAPADQHEVRREMELDSYYQYWSALQRRSQEMMWESVIDPTERALPELIARSRRRAQRGDRGSLRLDPNLPTPRYHTAVDIHLQPGGYHTDFGPNDVAAGAIYDQALYLYSHGGSGAENDSMGELLLQYYRSHWPAANPARLLDLGCGIGNSLLPWARALPRCEVHGVDVAAPMLRYGHARAEALRVPVHFSQQNAERTDFPAASFDVVISHLALHETSRSALPRILAECHRLLKPHGVMLHLEIPRGATSAEKFFYNWEVYNNNETFAQFLTDLDLAPLAVAAGFSAAKTRYEPYARPRVAGQHLYGETFYWKILAAER